MIPKSDCGVMVRYNHHSNSNLTIGRLGMKTNQTLISGKSRQAVLWQITGTSTMANTAQIKCINKNPRNDIYHAITHVGGFADKQWKLTLDDAIGKIERGMGILCRSP